MQKVLVTGASGFIAEHCIIELLKNGYAVKGSLRSINRAVSYTHLTLPTICSV